MFIFDYLMKKINAIVIYPEEASKVNEDFITKLPFEILVQIACSFSIRDLGSFYEASKKFSTLSTHEQLPCVRLTRTIFNNILKLPNNCNIEIEHINTYANYFGEIRLSQVILKKIDMTNDLYLGTHNFCIYRRLVDITDNSFSLKRQFKVTYIDKIEINKSMSNKNRASLIFAIEEFNEFLYTSQNSHKNDIARHLFRIKPFMY